MAGKTRKLPRDLQEACRLASVHNDSSSKVGQAYELLHSTSISDFQASGLSADQIATYVIARYGVQQITVSFLFFCYKTVCTGTPHPC